MTQSQFTASGGKRPPDRSPFPGMDPFLEQYWRDVHASLIVAIKNAIQGQLPLDLWAQVEQGVSIDLVDESLLAVPDVQVVEQPTETGPRNIKCRRDKADNDLRSASTERSAHCDFGYVHRQPRCHSH